MRIFQQEARSSGPLTPGECMDSFLETYLIRGGMATLPMAPGGAVEAFIKEVEQGNFVGILSLLTAEVVSTVGVKKLDEIFAEDTREVRARGGVTGIEILQEWVDGGMAAVDVSMNYADGSVDRETMILRRENGEWKIDLTR